MTKINNLGEFATLADLWARYPNGGIEGDYAVAGDVEYLWDKYKNLWVNPLEPEPVDPTSVPRELKNFSGDVDIQRNLTVLGTIRANGVKQPNVGLFNSLASLQAKYPNPEVGMWAAVGTTVPAPIYACNTAGVWTATGNTGGVDGIDLEPLNDEIAARQAADTEASNRSAVIEARTGIMVNGSFTGLAHVFEPSLIPAGTVIKVKATVKQAGSFSMHVKNANGTVQKRFETSGSVAVGTVIEFPEYTLSDYSYAYVLSYSVPAAITVSRPELDNASMAGRLDVLETLPSKLNTLEESEYLTAERKAYTTDAPVPDSASITNFVEVRTAQQFLSALNGTMAANKAVVLKRNITLNQDCVVNLNSKDITIVGGDHRVVRAKTSVGMGSQVQGTMMKATYSGSLNGRNAFIDDAGTVYNLSRSKYYTADSVFLNENAEELTDNTHATGTVRCFKLPEELADLEIAEGNSAFVNFTVWFLAYTMKVKNATGGYLYFYWDNTYTWGSTWDSWLNLNSGTGMHGERTTSFYLINHEVQPDACYINSGTITYPAAAGQLQELTGKALDVRGSGSLSLQDLNLTGENVLYITTSSVVMNRCEIYGCNGWYPVVLSNNSNASLWINDCYIHDMQNGAVWAGRNTYINVKDSTVKRLGTSRCNVRAMHSRGVYYFGGNIFEDYGTIAISVGFRLATGEENTIEGVIENNTIKLSPECWRDNQHTILMDAGAITCSKHMKENHVRGNIIGPYTGRWNNSGIFGDDGACNCYIYNNVIGNTPNCYSINFRYAVADGTGYQTDGLNTNKVVTQNIVSNGILLQGKTGTNGCSLGENLISKTYATKDTSTSNVDNTDDQVTVPLHVADGVPMTDFDLSVWEL